MITISKIQDRRFESRLDETGGLQVVIHDLTCLVRTGMTVLRWYYLSQSFFTVMLNKSVLNYYSHFSSLFPDFFFAIVFYSSRRIVSDIKKIT